MSGSKGRKDIVEIVLLGSWTRRAHPLLRIFTGGKRAKAGEYFLEVERTLHDIYQSFVLIENFLNRGNKELFVGKAKDKITVSHNEKLWMLGYLVDNAYLRIGACLDKIGQMVRIYYEHMNHGGPLLIYPRCGKCEPIEMNESSCSFGAVVHCLHKAGRTLELDNALFTLEKSTVLSDIKKTRNKIAHKLNKNAFYPGLDPDIKVQEGDFPDTQKTTFKFSGDNVKPSEYRRIIASAHNEIATQLNVIGPIVFPE